MSKRLWHIIFIIVLFQICSESVVIQSWRKKLQNDAEQAAPPSSPHYKNSQAETGTDKQLAQADTNRVAEHEVLNAKKSAEKAQTVVQEATIEVAQEEQAIKNVPLPQLTPEAAAAAHRMTAHELEKQAKQLIEDANKHAKEATAEATQSETVAAQATATTDLKSAAEEAQEAGKHSVKAVTLSDQAVDEANKARKLLTTAKLATSAADTEMQQIPLTTKPP